MRPLPRRAWCGNDSRLIIATRGRLSLKVIGVTGWSGSGKTTLLTALLPLFTARGLSVSTVKHAHRGFDLDRPGKDSFRHREAGAREVLIASSARWALMHELAPAEAEAGEPGLAFLLGRLSPVDLVLVEGFKANSHPKIEVHRPELGQPPIWPGRGDIVAVASDYPLRACDKPLLPLNEPLTIVDWVLHFLATVAENARAP
jgi:molybdopterin-guanine dinucleotide biosynthesis adapter protein